MTGLPSMRSTSSRWARSRATSRVPPSTSRALTMKKALYFTPLVSSMARMGAWVRSAWSVRAW